MIIAPSFADIFYNNCIKNGILLIPLKKNEIDKLFQQVYASPGIKITADSEKQTLIGPEGSVYHFEIDSFSKHCLIKGLDQIGWTEQFNDRITAYEDKLKNVHPWLA